MVSPNRPSCFIPATIWAGYSSLCSSSLATGMISLSTKSRTVARMSRWISVRPSVCARRPMARLRICWSVNSSGGRLGTASRLGTAGLLAAALLDVRLGRHHYLAAEDAHQGAALRVAAGFDLHDAPVVLRLGRPLAEHGGLAVDGVAVERRREVPERLDLQVGDGLAGDVWHRHAEQQGVDVVAHHHVPAEVSGLLRVVRVQVQRVVVHGEEAEQVVVVLGDRLAWPVLVDRPDLELLVGPSELHRRCPSLNLREWVPGSGTRLAQGCGGSNFVVRCMPAARPLPAITRAILREASSIISSPSMADPLAPPASEVHQS